VGLVEGTNVLEQLSFVELDLTSDDGWDDALVDVEHPTVTPYVASKTLAEQAAWDYVKNEAPAIQLTVINLSFVLDAPLDENYGSSIEVIKEAFPGRKVVTRPAPGWLIKIIGFFDKHMKAILPSVGRIDHVTNQKAMTLLDMDFTDPAESIRTSAKYMIDNE
jgi:hypothetical protein